MKKPYTIELYSCCDNQYIHMDLDDVAFSLLVTIAIAFNKQNKSIKMHIYENHVVPRYFGNDGEFEEIV